MTFRERAEEFAKIRKRKFLGKNEYGEDIKAVKVLSFVNHYIPTAFFVFAGIGMIISPALSVLFWPTVICGAYTGCQIYDSIKNRGTKIVGVHPVFTKIAKAEIAVANALLVPARLLTKGSLFIVDKASVLFKNIKAKIEEKKQKKNELSIEINQENTIDLEQTSAEQVVESILQEPEKKKKFSVKKIFNFEKKQEEYDIQEKDEIMSM